MQQVKGKEKDKNAKDKNDSRHKHHIPTHKKLKTKQAPIRSFHNGSITHVKKGMEKERTELFIHCFIRNITDVQYHCSDCI